MNNFVRISMIVVGIALMLTATAIGYMEYLKSVRETVAEERPKERYVLVATQDVAAGAVVTEADIRWQSVGEKQVTTAAIYRDKSTEVEVVGKRLQRPVVAGEAFTLDIVEPISVPDSLTSSLNSGFRAVTIPIKDTDTASGLLHPNDRIDIVSLVSEGGGTPSIDIPFIDIGTGGKTRGVALLRNVRVLAIGGKLKEAGSGTLTLELAPSDAIRLLAADKEGDLGVIIRRPDEEMRHSEGLKDPEGAPERPVLRGPSAEESPDASDPPKLIISRGKTKKPLDNAALAPALSPLPGVP